MNWQILHQILTGLSVAQGIFAAILLKAGCIENGAAYDCAASTWPTWLVPYLVIGGAVMVALKPIVTMAQGGFTALYKPLQLAPPRDETGKFAPKS